MKIDITYCTMWNYEPEASRVEDEIKSVYSDAQITLIKGTGGIFEIRKDEKLIYSKAQTQKFPEVGEINELLK